MRVCGLGCFSGRAKSLMPVASGSLLNSASSVPSRLKLTLRRIETEEQIGKVRRTGSTVARHVIGVQDQLGEGMKTGKASRNDGRTVCLLLTLAALGGAPRGLPAAEQSSAPRGPESDAAAALRQTSDVTGTQPPMPDPSPGIERAPTSPGFADKPVPLLGAPLITGQAIEPIDLAAALRLGGANDLDIAIARERVCQAIADWQQARVLWLPSLYLGPNWIRHDGQTQIVQGPVVPVSKSSLFLGATAAGGSSVAGPVPAGGPAPVSGLTSILRISDAIYTPLAARRVVTAQRAGLLAATNDALLAVAEAYFNLQSAAGRLGIAREAVANAETLASLTATYARSGAGLEADYRRSLTERDRQRKNAEAAVGDLEIASAELVRLIRLDPRVVVAPLEPPEALVRLVPDDSPLDELIPLALRNRPELAEAQALVQATLVRLRQARLRPLIPSLAFRFSGGGFGGGVNGFFGAFGARSDVDVNLFWEVQNLGMADRAIARNRASQQREAVLQQLKVQDRIAAEVVAGHKAQLAAARQVAEAGRALPEALSSLQLNLKSIREGAFLPGATRPIEVLQPIQALAQARADYLDAVLAYNRAQFRLYRALGQAPALAPSGTAPGQPR